MTDASDAGSAGLPEDVTRLEACLAKAEADLARFRHAFETTAADRDRLAEALAAANEEVGRLRYAFTTTAADRDRLLLEAANRNRGCQMNAVLPYVIVLSQPRTGSTLVQSLVQSSNVVGSCEHIHALSAEGIAAFWLRHPWSKSEPQMLDALAAVTQKRLLHAQGLAVGPAVVVTIARDPIERACSDYFFFTHHAGGVADAGSLERALRITADDLARHLSERDWDAEDRWFFGELEQGLGLPVRTASPAAQGYAVLKREPLRLVIIRLDRMDRLEQALGEACGSPVRIDPLRAKANGAADFGYEPHYRGVIAAVRLDGAVLDRIVGLDWVRLCFTEAERAAMRARWSGRAGLDG